MVVPDVLDTIYHWSATSKAWVGGMIMGMAYLVECVELRSRTQRLCILPKENLSSRSRVDDNHRDVAQLNLKDGTVGFGPYAVLFGGILADLGEVANQRQATGSSYALDTGRGTDEFVQNDIENGRENDSHP